MDQNEILRRVDHTILTPTATWEQVKTVCDEGKQFGVASVCIPPRYVKRANGYVGGGLKICTVIGFPNGYATPETKVFETMWSSTRAWPRRATGRECWLRSGL